jgi:hypothetical protein
MACRFTQHSSLAAFPFVSAGVLTLLRLFLGGNAGPSLTLDQLEQYRDQHL